MHETTMRCKADVAKYVEVYGNPTGLPLTNATYATIRDAIRFHHGYWKPLTVGHHVGDLEPINARVPHIAYKQSDTAHIKPDEPTKIAYFRTEEHRRMDRVTVTRAGRYLAGAYHRHMDAVTIRNYADTLRVAGTDPSEFLHFAETEAEIEEIYTAPGNMNEGSCMRYDPDNWCLQRDDEYVHPSAVYAGPDTRVAYLKIGNAYKARCVVMDKGDFAENKRFNRIYGDATMMSAVLRAKGYTPGNLEGVRLQKLELDNGEIGAPYFDGDANRITIGDTYIHISEHGDHDNPNYQTCIVTLGNTRNCDSCDERFEESDLTYSDYNDEYYCEHCIDEHYVWAITSNTRHTDLVYYGDTVECQDDGQYYVNNERVMRYHNVVLDIDSNARRIDETTQGITLSGHVCRIATDDISDVDHIMFRGVPIERGFRPVCPEVQTLRQEHIINSLREILNLIELDEIAFIVHNDILTNVVDTTATESTESTESTEAA